MHIPDGYLSPPWWIGLYIVTIAYGIVAWRKVRNIMDAETVMAVAVLAAGIFVAMMFNWPIPGGTSLHFVGGALAGILLGPWLAFFVYAMVLGTQALVFHDGGDNHARRKHIQHGYSGRLGGLRRLQAGDTGPGQH